MCFVRKRYSFNNKRKGFLLPIVLMFIMLTAVITYYSIENIKFKTEDNIYNYFYENGEILARNSAEFAIMAIHGHDRNATNNCVKEINLNIQNIYHSKVLVYYFSYDLPDSCPIIANVSDEKLKGVVLLDITITLSPSIQKILPIPMIYRKRILTKI